MLLNLISSLTRLGVVNEAVKRLSVSFSTILKLANRIICFLFYITMGGVNYTLPGFR